MVLVRESPLVYSRALAVHERRAEALDGRRRTASLALARMVGPLREEMPMDAMTTAAVAVRFSSLARV